jgi:hypothetical protein
MPTKIGATFKPQVYIHVIIRKMDDNWRATDENYKRQYLSILYEALFSTLKNANTATGEL